MTKTAPLSFPAVNVADHPELPSYVGRWDVVEWTDVHSPAPNQVVITVRGPGEYHLEVPGDRAFAADLFAEPSLRHLAGASLEDEPKTVRVALWSQLSRDRLIVAYDDSRLVVAAERETRRPLEPWTLESFLLNPKGFKVVAEKVNGHDHRNPSRARVHFTKVAGDGLDVGLFDIFADDSIEPYDRLLFNAASGALESIYGWRQVSIQPARSESGRGTLFAMFDRRRLASARARFMLHEARPDVAGDDVGVWGAEEG